MRRWLNNLRWRIVWRLMTDEELNLLHDACRALDNEYHRRRVTQADHHLYGGDKWAAFNMLNKLAYGRNINTVYDKITPSDFRRFKRIKL